MTRGFNFGPRTMTMFLCQVATVVVAGALTWDWMMPQSFLGTLGFITVWGVVSTYSLLLAGSVFMIVSNTLRRLGMG